MAATKRPRSREASVYPTTITANGKTYHYWVAARNLDSFNGKRRRETYRFSTEREARRKLSEILRETPKKPGPNLKLEAYLNQWLEDQRNKTFGGRVIKPKTLERYEGVCRVYLIPVLGHIRLDKLEPRDVDRLIDAVAKRTTKRKAGRISSTTVRKIYAVLSSALSDARKIYRYIPTNVAELVAPPEIAEFKPHALSVDEATRLFTAIDGDPLSPFFAVIFAFGLRLGEALGLTWDVIESDWSKMAIRQELQWLKDEYADNPLILTKLTYDARRDGKTKPYLLTPKTKSSKRELPLPDAIVTLLKAHKVRQAETLLKGRDRLVFMTEDGTPYRHRNVERSYDRYLVKAGLPKLRIHDLRHSQTSFLRALGVDPELRRDILGHSSSRMTDEYTHTSTAERRQALDLVARLIPTAAPA